MSDFAASFSFLLFSHSSLNSLDQSYFPHLLLFFSSCYYRIFKNRLGLVRFRFLLFSASSLPSLQCRHGNPVAIVLCLRRHFCASGLFRLSDFVPSRCRRVGRPSQPISIGRGVGASSTRGRALVPGQSAPGSALVPHKAPAASDESCATPCDYSSDPAGLDYCMVLLHPLQPPL